MLYEIIENGIGINAIVRGFFITNGDTWFNYMVMKKNGQPQKDCDWDKNHK